jgi:microcystin degradation protein MlrC
VKRILIAECKQEVSSFNPVPSHYDDFDVAFGADVLTLRGGGIWTEITGAMTVFGEHDDIELVPTYTATSHTSGGQLVAADWERIASEFLGALRTATDIDGVYFALHGAMSAEGEDDPEGHRSTCMAS